MKPKLFQKLPKEALHLFEWCQDKPVIDTHEHIPVAEEYYNNTSMTFGQLFNPYVSNDLKSAGMPFPRDQWPAFHAITDDWAAFAPYWESVRHTSYARPIRIALQHYFDVEDFTEQNYRDIVERINANNTPGIYDRILGKDCHIEWSVVCSSALPAQDDPLLKGNINSPSMQLNNRETVENLAREAGMDVPEDLEALVAVSDAWMTRQKEQGAIQFKSRSMSAEIPDRSVLEVLFQSVLNNKPKDEKELYPLWVWMREENARKAAELDLPIALHTGVWEDFRRMKVEDIIGLIERNPDTRFDVYHLGIPHVRPAIQIVKNYQNAWLNLCWAHVVASDMVVQTLKEAIDMVPLNKIFAFGADYVFFIEKVYGHLQMARENVALALGDRVERSLMDREEAEKWMHAWFYDNPKRFYRI